MSPHSLVPCAHFITLTLAQVRALSALHSRPSSCHPCGCCLFDLTSSFYLFAFLLSFFPLPLLQPQRRAAARAQQEDHRKTCATPLPTGVRAPTTSSTSPQMLREWHTTRHMFHSEIGVRSVVRVVDEVLRTDELW